LSLLTVTPNFIYFVKTKKKKKKKLPSPHQRRGLQTFSYRTHKLDTLKSKIPINPIVL